MIELEITHNVTAAALVVALDLRNRGTEAVYVPVLPVDAEFKTYANSAYVHLTNDETAVCLVLGPSLLPTDSDVEVQMAAYCTKLPAGGRLQHVMRFPLPLREWYAYFVPVPSEEDESILVYQIRVFVEFVLQSQVASVKPAPGNEGFFHVTPKNTEMFHQRITLDDRLPVLKCEDEDFPRL